MEQQHAQQQEATSVRIYREGMSSEGTVVSLGELEAMLNDGRLTGHYLIAVDGAWRPLNSVYDIPEVPRTQHVDESETELALSLKQLPSVLAVGGGPIDAGRVMVVSGGKTSKKSASRTSAVVVCMAVIVIILVAWLLLKG